MNNNQDIAYVYYNILNAICNNIKIININGCFTKQNNIIKKIFNRHYQENMNKDWYKPNLYKQNTKQWIGCNWFLFEIYMNKKYIDFLKILTNNLLKYKKNIIFGNIKIDFFLSNYFYLTFFKFDLKNIIIFKVNGQENYTLCYFDKINKINGINNIFKYKEIYELKQIIYKNNEINYYQICINDCKKYYHKHHNPNSFTLTQYCDATNNGCKLKNNGCKLKNNGCKLKNNGGKLKNNGCKLKNDGDKLKNDGCKLKKFTLTQYFSDCKLKKKKIKNLLIKNTKKKKIKLNKNSSKKQIDYRIKKENQITKYFKKKLN